MDANDIVGSLLFLAEVNVLLFTKSLTFYDIDVPVLAGAFVFV